MRTISLIVSFLILTTCQRSNGDPYRQIVKLDECYRSASILSEMQRLMLTASLGAKTWVTEQSQSLNKTRLRSILKAREYENTKERLKSLSSAWPHERKEKVNGTLVEADAIIKL